MKTSKIRLVITCLLLNLAVGLPCFSGATFFMRGIIIFSKNHGTRVVQVDDEDFELVSQYRWYIKKEKYTYYACCTRGHKKKEHYKMHRIIMGVTDPKILIDHINGDGIDNRKENLRRCTNSENMRNARMRKDNSTGYRGVKFEWGKYLARIKTDKKVISLGRYKTAIEAARAYNAGALKYHGEFARLNEL